MSALLAPLAPITNLLLPSGRHSTGLPDDPGSAETTTATTSTPSSNDLPIPTAPNDKQLGVAAQETGTRELYSSDIATAVPNAASQAIPVSTQTGHGHELQPAIPTSTTATTTTTTTIVTPVATGLYGALPGRGSPSRLPVPQKAKYNAAAAAHYLRTADIRDLPSFPSAGLSHPEAAGAAAALLAHSSHKPVEIWRPVPISAAGAAASLAHANLKRTDTWKATPDIPAGKAALHALEGPSSPQPYEMSEASKRWSLNGAIGAMQGSKARRRSSSLTIQQEAEAARAGNSALTAAAIAHMPSQEKRKSDILRAATISMSKSNCDTTLPSDTYKQKTLVQPDLRPPATTPPSRRYNNSNIEEAARKVAAERLAKIGYNSENLRSASLLGTQGAQASLNRSYTVASATSGDLGRARKINADMALMQDNLVRVDAKKRGENAVLLMSAAQRNVQARMSGIDKQVAESRGLVHREDWNAKAVEIAQAGSDKRMKHHGKVSIGGGAYMTPEEIDAIAERNVQPVLNEINRNTEAERARLEAERARELEMQLDIGESRRVQDLQRTREKETREDIKRAKAAEKEEEKRRREEEKRAAKERKQLAKVDSKRGRESMGTGDGADWRRSAPPTSPKPDNSEGGIRGLINRFRKRHSRQVSHDEKNAIANDAVIPTFSGGHRAAMAQQQQQQRAAETSDSTAAVNRSVSPRQPASRIPRPVSTVIVPRTNGTPINLGSPTSVRAIAITDTPLPITNGNSAEVRRRHSLSSVGSTGHRLKGRKISDGTPLSPWTEGQGVSKGRFKINRRKTGDFSKANGRIGSIEDNAEYPDEARDTFSQHPRILNRPTSGYFPQGERRFSTGETSMSSRFRENL